MKFAIMSDVHGNAPALRLALEDARKQGAEGFLFAGDYCISAPWPNEVVDLIRSLPCAHVIRGNNDDMYVFPDDDSGQYEVARWCRSTLTEENRRWLRDLPAELTLVCEGVTIRMAHSSEAFVGRTLHAHYRTSSLTRMYPDGPVSHERLLADFRRIMANDEDFMVQIDRLDEGVYVFGHNHIQCHGDFHGRLLVNPGGCGDPLDCGECCAPYTLLTVENGHAFIEERRIPYDPEPLIAQVRKSEQYAAARVWSELTFASWRTRREKAGSFIRYCIGYAERLGDDRRPIARDTWEAAFDEWQAVAPTLQPELFVHRERRFRPMKRSFMTTLPDKTGAFLEASHIILRHGGNMTRASYNKAVDAHTLFLDVEAEEAGLEAIEAELTAAGFLQTASPVKIVLAEFEVPDAPGATIPVLETLARYRISISYISSQPASGGKVALKLGLYIEEPGVIETLLRELSTICAVRILDYDAGEKRLDNTVFYLTFADEMRRVLRMTQEQTSEFIYYTNLVMQQLEDKGEPPEKTFGYISRFAHFVVEHGGTAYDCRITAQRLTERVNATVIEPPCGSNITVLEDEKTRKLLVIDGGFSYYKRLTMSLLRRLIPDFDMRKREMLLTHSDSDHSGLSRYFDTVWCSRRTADCFASEHLGQPCPREENPNMLPYYRLSNLIADYEPPQLSRLRHLDQQACDDSQPLSVIGTFDFADLHFTVLQGNGGHVPGETVLIDEAHRIAITGDDYINARDCTAPQKEFNQLAPYLARSVNQDSAKYRLILRALKDMMDGEGWLILPGHGAILQRDQRM